MYTTTGLKAERYLVEGQDSLALQVGAKSLQTDRSLTAMRVFALSRENLLGEKLFDFPQYNGSQGLLPSLSDTTYAHDWTKALYKHLGGKPGEKFERQHPVSRTSVTTAFGHCCCKRLLALLPICWIRTLMLLSPHCHVAMK